MKKRTFKLDILTSTMIVLTVIVCVALISRAQSAKAQEGLVAGGASASFAVPISTAFDYNTTMQHMKDFTLDRLATLLAKQILHQMTASVVNWINSGFEGNPSFLTNPGAFFLDAADQVTGAFIAGDGPLSRLCSPFSLDIRLSIALNQAQFINQRYTCTLGSIINNVAKNKSNVTLNGQSINNFTGSNFHQGGWSGFLALTTEPQNNPYGGFLQGQADLYSQISARQNRTVLDLQLGNGFLSYTDCETLGTIDPDNEDDYATAESYSSGVRDVNRKVNSDGTVTYEKCTTKTPGSVISGTLQKTLDVPADELELANDINAVVNALVTQMITQLMSKGLSSLSSGHNNQASYTQQLIEDSTNANNAAAQAALQSLQSQVTASLENASVVKLTYDQAVGEIVPVKSRIESAIICSTMYKDEATSLLNNSITPYYNLLVLRQKTATDQLKTLQSINDNIASTGSVENAQLQANRYTQYLQSGGLGANDTGSAQAVLADAKAQAKQWNAKASTYLYSCTNSTTP